MAGSGTPGIERVRTYLSRRGFSGAVLEFDESSATVELAAQQVGTAPERIAKTLSFIDPADPARALLVVTAGDAKVNSGKFKRTFGGKARMVPAADVERLTGYTIGGVCPFANPAGTRVFLDESLRRFTTVFPAAGSANSAVQLAIGRLEALSEAAGWVDVATGWGTAADQ